MLGSSARKTSQWLVFSENGKRSEATRSPAQVVLEASVSEVNKSDASGVQPFVKLKLNSKKYSFCAHHIANLN
jgi:hypothetical protein